MREILFVAGEASGDLHAAGVARALAGRGAPFRLTGIGGDEMQAAGVELVEHAERLAVMGFVEVLKHIPLHYRLARELERRIRSGSVALVVLIDYPGFNMKIAAAARAAGVPVLTPFVDIANARLTFDSGAVANITASRVSRERMRKLRIFQQSGYLSLDLGSGDGEFFRLRGDVDIAALAAAPLALEQFVERIPLRAEEGEPLRLEFESFLAAVRGEQPIAVTGEEGREALAVALQIVADIERSLPALSGRAPAAARA